MRRPAEPIARVVGTCAHCRGDVILTRGKLGTREASCPCGATVIPVSFFQGLGRRFTTAVRS